MELWLLRNTDTDDVLAQVDRVLASATGLGTRERAKTEEMALIMRVLGGKTHPTDLLQIEMSRWIEVTPSNWVDREAFYQQ